MENMIYCIVGMVLGVVLTFSAIWSVNPKTFRQRLKAIADPKVSTETT